MEQQILFKIQELKKLFNNNINNFEDFMKNKEFILYIMEQIESFINQNFNNNNISSIDSNELNKKKEYNYDSFDYNKRYLDDKFENQNTISSNNEVENKEENKVNEIYYSKNNNNLNIDKKTDSTHIQSNYLPIENNNYENLNNNKNINDIDNEKNNNLNNSKNFTSFRPQLNFNYDEDFVSQKGDNQENNMNIMDNISDIKSENSTQKKNYITN